MKKCAKCGCEIVNGVNGCQLMDICFNCHGGYPKYPSPTEANDYVTNWKETDALEDMCVRDCDE